MSKKKQGGKLTQQTRPRPKFLGVKVADGEKVSAGYVLIRQRGTTFHPGKGVKEGRDHSLYAGLSGVVKFGQRLGKKLVSIVS